MTDQITKRQHYIPQFYLKGFSEDQSQLFVFDKMAVPEKQFRFQTTENIAFENHFYTYETVEHTKENLEVIFQQLEGQAAEIIRKIERGVVLNPQDRADFAFFISTLWVRTPSFRDETIDVDTKMYEKIMRLQSESMPDSIIIEFYRKVHKRDPTKSEIDDLRDFGSNPKRSKLVVTFPPGYWVKRMLKLSMDTCKYFQMMNWVFVHSDKQYSFITSDNPRLLIPPKQIDRFRGVGLITPGAVKVIPINSHISLQMYDVRDKWTTIHTEIDSKDTIRFINYNIAREARRFIFSSHLGKLEVILKKDKIARLPPRPQFSID